MALIIPVATVLYFKEEIYVFVNEPVSSYFCRAVHYERLA